LNSLQIQKLSAKLEINEVGDGGSVRQPFVKDFALKMKLAEMQEDLALKISVNATLQLRSGDRFQKANTKNLRTPI